MFLFVDIPGTYSLMSTSEEEEIARNYICFGNPDATIVVVDATSLERNLNLVFQIMEITPNVIVCVNLLDEARKKGIKIDLNKLQKLLNCPVVGTIATKKKTLGKLLKETKFVCNEKNIKPNLIKYSDNVENAINLLLPIIQTMPNIPEHLQRWKMKMFPKMRRTVSTLLQTVWSSSTRAREKSNTFFQAPIPGLFS